MGKISIILLLMLGLSPLLWADSDFQLPDDPRQSITYWKSYELPADDPRVQRALSVFATLLQGWDQSRLAPGLSVIKSADGAWAASLADGNILLSQQAVDICLDLGKQRGDDLLAFVLAHELAHQRADDLWHQRFFRMMGGSLKQQIQQQLKLEGGLGDVEQKEARADHDGLILMASVGYDPFQVIESGDFFTAWVENIWQQSCPGDDSHQSMYQACHLAKQRALRARTQLQQVAGQSLLYEMGLQSFIAGDYSRARQYLIAYGREYPGRQVMAAIGLSYLAEAVKIRKQRISIGARDEPDFYFPLFMEARDHLLSNSRTQLVKRASLAARQEVLLARQKDLLKQAVKQFENAIRLSPNYRRNYIFLAMAYLLQKNNYLLRGVVQGKYIPAFGNDMAAAMLLAMNEQLEGHIEQAIAAYQGLENTIVIDEDTSKNSLLVYSLYYNYTALLESEGKHRQAKSVWSKLAKRARESANSMLFRLALAGLGKGHKSVNSVQLRPGIDNAGLGDVLPSRKDFKQQDIWIEGERFRFVHDGAGHNWIVNPRGYIDFAWQSAARDGASPRIKGLRIGDQSDRVFKRLGIPDRQVSLSNGDVMAFDKAGVAIQIRDNKIRGWFLYQPNGS